MGLQQVFWLIAYATLGVAVIVALGAALLFLLYLLGDRDG